MIATVVRDDYVRGRERLSARGRGSSWVAEKSRSSMPEQIQACGAAASLSAGGLAGTTNWKERTPADAEHHPNHDSRTSNNSKQH
jgi:hypothetical protein